MTYNTVSSQQPLLSETQSRQQTPPTQIFFVLPSYPPPNRHRLLRRSCRRGLISCAIVFIFLFAAGYLLWPSDPEISVVRIRLDRLQFHMRPKISLDLTLDLTVRAHNPDLYSVEYDSMIVSIVYRGKRLGDVVSDGGNITAQGTSYINATLQLTGVEFLDDVMLLLADLAKGQIPLDTETQISGTLRVFFFDLPIKKQVSCKVIANTHNQTVYRQNCYPEVFNV